MNERSHIHLLHALLAVWLIAVAILTMAACGKDFLCEVCGKPAYNHECCPPAPCPVCGSAELCDCAPPIVEESTAHGD